MYLVVIMIILIILLHTLNLSIAEYLVLNFIMINSWEGDYLVK